MKTVQDDIEALVHIKNSLPGPIYIFEELSDTTKNIITTAGFPHFFGIECHVLLYKNDSDWLLSTLNLIVEED